MPQHRAVELLHQVGRAFPMAWDIYARLLADHQKYKRLPASMRPRHHEDWPDWCWAPLAAAHAVMTAHQERERFPLLDPDKIPRALLAPRDGVGALGALAAWRATQGIYRLDPDLLAALLDTPITGDVPIEVLRRMPEWCVYVETPGLQLTHWVRLHGFFAFLEYDITDGHSDLRFALDIEPSTEADSLHYLNLVPLMIPLGGTLDEGIARTEKLLFERLPQAKADSTMRVFNALYGPLQGLVSVLLYLCSDEAEVPRRPMPPRVVTTKKGRTIAPTSAPTVHPCGTRLGAQLRLARETMAEAEERARARGVRFVAPHIRRAHWHTFLTGPRDGARSARVKWLPPIPVNLEGAPTVATVRPVKP